jgi:glutaredoxin
MQVLLLTDFSVNSKKMQEYALNFFEETPAHFTLLHSKKPNADRDKDPNYKDCNTHKELEKELYILKSKLKPFHTASKVFINQNLVDSVRMFIKNATTYMIFMGGKGRTSDASRQFGKNTFDIVKKVRCPIMVVFENSSVKIPHKVAFPLDNTNLIQEKYLKTLRKLSFWKSIELSIYEVPNKMIRSHLLKNFNEQAFSKTFSDLDFKLEKPHMRGDKVCYNCIKADMIMFMAKNLSISNQIFDQIDTETTDRQTPLLVLHA